jgi:N-carbamoyl-L-amino-acid hydrolase
LGGGLTGSTALASSPHLGELSGYLELHIEQGPRLEAAGLELGVVEGIIGIDRWDVRLVGAANHAGTTPMAMRHDAGAAAGRVLAGLAGVLAGVDPEMVGNVGRLELLPGATNVVPGEALFTVELRSINLGSLRNGAVALESAVAEAGRATGCTYQLSPRSSIAPVAMDPAYVVAIEQACSGLGRRYGRLVSGAGHDAGVLARQVPAGMIFVPSGGGVSHSPAEHTDDHLLLGGCEALLAAILQVLGFAKA